MALTGTKFMPTIDQGELETLLRDVRGTTTVGVVMLTPPKMNKTLEPVVDANGKKSKRPKNPMYGRVMKRTHRQCMIGFIYANSVNNQLEREGLDADFVAEPRKWGTRIAGTPLVEHKGKLHLECKVDRLIQEQYYLDGQEVDKSVVEPYLVERDDVSRQGVEKQVILIDPLLTNIEQLRMFGDIYDVVQEDAAIAVAG
jgi:hypothetical protein